MPFYTNTTNLKRSFSTTSILFGIDPKDGLSLDRTQDIADNCKSSKEVKDYFEAKENSIKDSHRIDSNTASPSGMVDVIELDGWLQRKNDLLKELKWQQDDVHDLGDYTESEQSDTEIEETAQASSNATVTVDQPQKSTPATATNNTQHTDVPTGNPNNGSSSTSYQDSSDIVQTEFDPSDYYEDW